ncbi:hypothetical protein QCA50_013603 [Cerrena zonata]|uniref:Uncharacterized protein n=1 Tax=Cerrena zonata TaxID=2478898 RepID=A0AAW0G132_9APHY
MQEKSNLHFASVEASGSVTLLRDNIWHIQLLLLSILTALNELKKLKLTSRRLKLLEELAINWEIHCSTFRGLVFRSRREAECILSNVRRVERCVGQMGSDPHDNSELLNELGEFMTSSVRFKRRAQQIVDDIKILESDISIALDSLKSLVDDRPLRAILFSTIADAHDEYVKIYCRIEQDILALREELLRVTKSECYQIVFASALSTEASENESTSDNEAEGHDEKYSKRPQVNENATILTRSWVNAISELQLLHGFVDFVESTRKIPDKKMANKLLSARIQNVLKANNLTDQIASNIEIAIYSQLPVL